MEIPGAAPREERRETEPVRRVFEYRDTEGNLIGTAEVTLGAEKEEMPYVGAKEGEKAEGRRLLSFILRGEKGGKPSEIDLLGLANRHGVEILSADVRLVNYEYSDEKKRAVVPPLETPLDVGVFLHELGHADQFHEERFGKITPLYGRSRQSSSAGFVLSYGSMRELLDAVVDAVPEAKIAMDHEILAQLETLEGRRHAALDLKAERERALDEQERLRDDELATFVEDALSRVMDIRDFLRRCDAAAGPRKDASIPPLVATPEAEAFIGELERAGFVFDGDGEEGGVPRSSLRDAASVAAFLRDALTSMRAASSSLTYDAAAGRLGVDAAIGKAGRLRIKDLPVDEDDHAAYAKVRARADEIVAELEARADSAYDDVQQVARAQQLLMEHIDVNAITSLPTKMMERDATRRALQWLREARGRTGADLLKTHAVPPEALIAVGKSPDLADGCVGSVADGMGGEGEAAVEATVLDDLKRALKTYGADKLRLRPPDDDVGMGISPVAGLDRTKKKG